MAGESYRATPRPVIGDSARPGVSPEQEDAVRAYFDVWERHLADWQATGGRWRPYRAVVPVGAMQAAAIGHPNAKVRRECLGVLDHFASDQSVGVFLEALLDPVPRVRLAALHGIACERCRVGDLDVPDAVGALLGACADDASPKVRHAAVETLARFVDRDERVVPALDRLGSSDPDDLVRVVATAAVRHDRRDVRSRKALRRRRVRLDQLDERGGGARSALRVVAGRDGMTP